MDALLVNYLISFSLMAFSFPAIAIFIVIRNKIQALNGTFALYLVSVAWWAFFSIFMITAYQKEFALFWDRMCLSGTVWIPSLFFHFVMIYTSSKGKAYPRFLIVINYFISFVFLIFLWLTPLFVQDVAPSYGLNYWTVPGPLYLFFIGFFLECAIVAIIKLWHFQETIVNLEMKKQATILFWFSLIGYVGGSCDYLLSYQIKLPGVAEISNYGAFILGVSISYIIFRYRFLEVEDILAIHKDKLALVGLISSSINHEIKNPLFLIQEYTKKMQSKSTDPLLEKMSEQISRMGNLVERLNDFARPGSASVEDVYLVKAIKNALFFASQELRYQNIEVKLGLPETLPNLRGNRGQFEEIFLNLIMNAFHSMSPPDSNRIREGGGGTLTIEAKATTSMRPLDFARGDDAFHKSVMVSVIDTGHGIPKDQLKNIFKPFYTTKGKSGTGLGLHIVKTLVEQNGGKIQVESEVGKGTKFSLVFNNQP